MPIFIEKLPEELDTIILFANTLWQLNQKKKFFTDHVDDF
jgi:hypothetical protein